MRFFLGTHMAHWLRLTDVPLFVSHRQLVERQSLPRAVGNWALDSGGFTELSMFGEWRTTEDEYVTAARRYRDEIGNLNWAAPMDYMCEPPILAKTGLTVLEHQRRTVENFLSLRAKAPDVNWIPVIQGWDADDYERCVNMYDAAGVTLRHFHTVGIGSVCRRQSSDEIAEIVSALSLDGIRLHGFGVKSAGLTKYAQYLVSSDSLAWSFAARNAPPIPGHERDHKNCANCMDYAMEWRRRLLGILGQIEGARTDEQKLRDAWNRYQAQITRTA